MVLGVHFPPRRDLGRVELVEVVVTEDLHRVGEQEAQLLERHRRDLVLGKIFVDELGEGQPFPDPPLAPEFLQRSLQRGPRVRLASEAAALHALRVASGRPRDASLPSLGSSVRIPAPAATSTITPLRLVSQFRDPRSASRAWARADRTFRSQVFATPLWSDLFGRCHPPARKTARARVHRIRCVGAKRTIDWRNYGHDARCGAHHRGQSR